MPPSDAGSSVQDAKAVNKRPRRPLNCEPCRNSKLKCDRNRPCSSCLLRGHVAFCYPSEDPEGSAARASIPIGRLVSPKSEFKKLRQSIALLESHIEQLHKDIEEETGQPGAQTPPFAKGQQRRSMSSDDVPMPSTPGHDECCSSEGPLGTMSEPAPPSSMHDTFDPMQPTDTRLQYERDKDLTSQLPPLSTVECLIDFYFENCNWILYCVHKPSFGEAWMRYKTGQFPCRLVIATVSIIMAIALRHLPVLHELLDRLPSDRHELTGQYYNIMLTALERYRMESDAYTLELVELLLLRHQFLTMAKCGSEEAWRVRGDLMSIATAMGLHRDPAHSDVPMMVAERRRWAWWHIISIERWQAFMLGRPLAIATAQFDVQLPSYCDPSVDKTGRLYAASVALFRLAHLMGDLVDDAVSFKSVEYSSVLVKDHLLQTWLDSLPQELNPDDACLSRGLASSLASSRRLAIQSVFVRSVYLHLRLSIHQPYAHSSHTCVETKSSTSIAIDCAEKLISLTTLVRPEVLGSTSSSTLSHLIYTPYHILSAALFFVFLACDSTDHEGSRPYRAHIYKAAATLNQLNRAPLAETALAILRVLEPLYEDAIFLQDADMRMQKKAEVLAKLALLLVPPVEQPFTGADASPQLASPASRPAFAMPSIWERLVSHAQAPAPYVASSISSSSSASSSAAATPASSSPSFTDHGAMAMSVDPSTALSNSLFDLASLSAFSPLSHPELFSPRADLGIPPWRLHHPAPPPTRMCSPFPGGDLAFLMRSVDEAAWPPAGFKDELAQFFDGLQGADPALAEAAW